MKFEKLATYLRQVNLKLQLGKCEFFRKKVVYLDHIIGENRVKPDFKRIEVIKEFPRPISAKNVKQFLGLTGYCRFIPNFSKVVKPLTNLLKKESALVWTDNHTIAFTQLRDALCSQPLL